jgi:excisionase family DNA binding protein
MKPNQIALSLREAAAAVDCSEKHLTRAIHAGDLPAKKVGREYRVGVVHLQAWFDALPDAD